MTLKCINVGPVLVTLLQRLWTLGAAGRGQQGSRAGAFGCPSDSPGLTRWLLAWPDQLCAALRSGWMGAPGSQLGSTPPSLGMWQVRVLASTVALLPSFGTVLAICKSSLFPWRFFPGRLGAGILRLLESVFGKGFHRISSRYRFLKSEAREQCHARLGGRFLYEPRFTERKLRHGVISLIPKVQ